METEMTQAAAINVLIQAAEIGRSKGAYSFDDLTLIAQAIKTFTNQDESLPSSGGEEESQEESQEA